LAVESWDAIFQALQLKGAARELARHCWIQSLEGSHLKLVLNDNHRIMLRDRPRNALRGRGIDCRQKESAAKPCRTTR